MAMMAREAVPDALRASAARYGSKVAFQIRQPGGEWRRHTFAELQEAAFGFAAGLRALGFKPGEHAAVILENGPEWVLGFLGIAAAGGAAVPIYYELRTEEIAYILRESDSRVAIVSRRVLPKLPPRATLPALEHLLVVNGGAPPSTAAPAGQGEPDARLAADAAWAGACVPFAEVASRATPEARAAVERTRIQPDELLAILYTSGTTGNPKGVMLTHANLAANVEQARRRIAVDNRDHILLVLPLHHVFPLMAGLVLPVTIGATVTLENDLRRVADRMGEVHPTVFLGVPALYALMMRRILERADAEGRGQKLRAAMHLVETVKQRTGMGIGPLLFRGTIHKRLGGKLRFMVSGGAALPPEVARQYYNLGLLLIQGWGLTETSPVVAAQEVSRRKFLLTRHFEDQLGTVGRPLDGIEVKLVDVPEKQILVEAHGEGELVLRGPNVMAGYYKNETATRAAFLLEDGGATSPWLRTGDVGRIDAQGNIYITGRAKDVIVLASGEKVYPDEVEEKLIESPLLAEVAVVGVRAEPRAEGGRQKPEGGRQDTASSTLPSAFCLPPSAPGPRPPMPAEAAGRVQAWAVIYPSYEALRDRASREGRALTDEATREWLLADVRRLEQDIAPYKRTSEVALVDEPLPKTPLRKVKRFEVAQMLAAGPLPFSLEHLRLSAEAVAAAAPPAEPAATATAS